ncbi:MAG: hypothetical protein WD733_20535 [Bryobacterales bacterium]
MANAAVEKGGLRTRLRQEFFERSTHPLDTPHLLAAHLPRHAGKQERWPPEA